MLRLNALITISATTSYDNMEKTRGQHDTWNVMQHQQGHYIWFVYLCKLCLLLESMCVPYPINATPSARKQ